MTNISAIVLAGGKSSRMGRDKAMIEVDGVPLIRRIYDVCVAVPDRVVGQPVRVYVLTPWMEKYQSLLPSDSGWIREEQPHQGPLIGFSQGLSHITTEWVLLLACDLPHLTTTAIESWVAELDAIPIATMAYLPKHPDKGWEPLCGFYRRSCLPSLLAHISTGGYSFQGWLQQCEVKELIITNPLWLFNCNTPIDLEQVIKLKST